MTAEKQEQPVDRLSVWRFAALGSFILLLFSLLVYRLFSLQLVDSNDYTQRAQNQSRRLLILPAPRGNIYDRHGHLLVGNRPCYNVVADFSDLRGEIRQEYAQLRRTDRQFRQLISATEESSSLSPEERAERRSRQKKRADELARLAPANVLQRYLDKVNAVLNRREVVDIDSAHKHLYGQRAIPYTLISDISEQELARFVEHFPTNWPIRISVESLRTYPYGKSAAYALGYLRTDSNPPNFPHIPENDPEVAAFLDQPNAIRNRTLKQYNGQIPATVNGVEKRFEEILAGTPGYQLWTVTPAGYLYEKLAEQPPQQGEPTYLSIDIDLQLAAENALAEDFPNHTGAVVAIDVKTGEVLVCANHPNFDPTRMNYLNYRKEFEEAGGSLWYNIATQYGYPPGSSFKPITAIAGLRSNVVNPEEIIECGPFLEINGRRFPDNTRWGHGPVDLRKMLKVSANVYCYTVGLRMGIESLAAEARRFGLDQPSTLEIAPAPTRNHVVPDPAYKRRIGQGGWVPGDTANTSIGQGFLMTTPLHMATMIASIARNETRTNVTILRDPERVQRPGFSHGGTSIGLPEEQYAAIIEGLAACADWGGTGRLVKGLTRTPVPGLKLLDISVAAKTGTAQVRNNRADVAWVLAFAPVENPQIAIAVMIEGKDGERFGGGTKAGPIANAVLAAWEKQQQGQQQP